MTIDQMIAALDHATADIAAVRAELVSAPTPPSREIRVTAGADLQPIVDQAAPGSTLVLDDGIYTVQQLRISKALTVRGRTSQPPRPATAPVTILGSAADGTLLLDGTRILIQGVGLRNTTVTGELANIIGTDITVDRVTGLGDPAKGLHRGFRLHGTRIVVIDSYFDHIFAFGRDSCVLGAWDGGQDITIDNCYLCGGAETILIGGADSSAAEKIPRNITVARSTLTKRPEWFGMGVQIKNAFELKSAISVHLVDCVLEYAGTAEGQGAYSILLTPRNQGGKAPWSTVEDVLIERCLCRYAGGAVQFLGSDNLKPSGTMRNVTIRNVLFTGLDPQGITKGAGRVFTFDRAPQQVTLDAITVEGQNLAALGYFANTPQQPVGLTITNMKFPPTKYGWKIDGGAFDVPPASKNLQRLMPDLVYQVTATDPGAVGYPGSPTR